MLNLTELIPRCHAGSRAKGFWDETPHQGQQLMLVISELSEALEAHRKKFWASLELHKICLEKVHHLDCSLWAEGEERAFRQCIKDTVEDELADAYIRLCDFAGGFELDAKAIVNLRHGMLPLPDNFGAALLGITAGIVMMDNEEYEQERCAGVVMGTLEALCTREGIDLATHIDLKLAYNATRPRMHDKAY